MNSSIQTGKYSTCMLEILSYVITMFIYSSMFESCLVLNYSNTVLLLSIFVLLHKQGKLRITRKKNKIGTCDRL